MPLFLREKRSSAIFISLIFFQLILISLQVPLGEEPSYVEKAIFFVFSPIQKGVTSFFHLGGNLWNKYVYLKNVQAQNQKMREELFNLRQENSLMKNALQRLKNKQEIEDYLSALHESFLLASVTGMDASNLYKSIVIDKGFSHGVKDNMVVVDRFGNLVGRVVNPLSYNEATVQLITDEHSGVSVYVQGNKVMGVLTGDARGKCLLKYILATDGGIREEEELITSGFDKIFPPGLKVGRIISIAEDSSLFKKIIVKPNFDFSELSLVAVLLKKTGEFF